jgi:Flp pilus assembly protein TadG
MIGHDSDKVINSQGERGAVLVIVVLLLIVLIGVAAYAIDVGHLMVVRNELQNGADAGALAGALALYDDTGNINTGANGIAATTAQANSSENAAVEVKQPETNNYDVQRGHWSFATETFTPNDSDEETELWDVPTDQLDLDTSFINAVRVMTRREALPATSIFAQIFGRDSFVMAAEAVAYIGFCGELEPGEADQPIAICKDSIKRNDIYTCNIGRMLNSGSDPTSSNTAGWTSFEMDDGTCSGTNTSELRPLTGCSGDGNPEVITYGQPIEATGGVTQTIFTDLRNCWWPPGDQQPTRPWRMTLPVVDCIGRNVGNCPVVVGAVSVDLIWMTEAGAAKPEDAPGANGEDMIITRMIDGISTEITWDYEDGSQCTEFKAQVDLPTETAVAGLPAGFNDPDRWQGESTYTADMARWDCFVDFFKLQNADGTYAPLAFKSMYYLPSCDAHVPKGRTGGENFGVLAQYPVLVNRQ